MSIPQRIYVYLAAFVSFAILLQGAYGLASDVARSLGSFTIGMDPEPTWIAMIIVGLPVWLAHEFLLRRAADRHSEETGSVLRKLYVNGALALVTLYVFVGCIQVIEDIAGDFDGLEHIGGALVAASLWYYLWRRENLEGQPTPRAQTVRRWRVYGLSVIFLAIAVTATYWITYGLAYATYSLVFEASDILITTEDFQDPLRTGAGWAIVGITAWAIQWLTVADTDEGSVLRQTYLYGFAFIGGASLALWGAAATIYIVIAQLVGADNTTTAVAYFRQFILPVVGLLIGVALLAYHWSILRRDAARKDGGCSRESKNLKPRVQQTSGAPAADSPHLSSTFKYIMSAVGLIALVPGLMALLMTLLDPLVGDNLFASTDEQEEFLAVALTMIIVGAPLWCAPWWRVLHADPRSLVRRIYLYVALIALGGTWLFTLIALLAAVLTEILGQGSGFLEDALIPSLSIVIPAAAFFAYHVTILRDDSRRTPVASVEIPSPRTPNYYVVPAPPYVIPTESTLRPE